MIGSARPLLVAAADATNRDLTQRRVERRGYPVVSLARFRAMGCALGQGDVFAPPRPSDEAGGTRRAQPFVAMVRG